MLMSDLYRVEIHNLLLLAPVGVCYATRQDEFYQSSQQYCGSATRLTRRNASVSTSSAGIAMRRGSSFSRSPEIDLSRVTSVRPIRKEEIVSHLKDRPSTIRRAGLACEVRVPIDAQDNENGEEEYRM